MIQQFISKQFMLFLMTGGTAAAVNIFSRILYNYYVDFSVAIVISYITGMFVAFILARLFVFKDSQRSLKSSIYFFILVNFLGILQMWVISMIMAHYILPKLGVVLFAREISHATGVVVPAFTSYLGHKYWSFR